MPNKWFTHNHNPKPTHQRVGWRLWRLLARWISIEHVNKQKVDPVFRMNQRLIGAWHQPHVINDGSYYAVRNKNNVIVSVQLLSRPGNGKAKTGSAFSDSVILKRGSRPWPRSVKLRHPDYASLSVRVCGVTLTHTQKERNISAEKERALHFCVSKIWKVREKSVTVTTAMYEPD